MMKYHCTKDMINLITYFPELSPIRILTIVESVDDYLKNYDFCKNLLVKDVSKYISLEYTEIPNFIWLDVIKNLIKKLPNMEEELLADSFKHFSISGHTEGKRYLSRQMFDKSRYELVKNKQ